MELDYGDFLKNKLGSSFEKLEKLNNKKLNNFLYEYLSLLNPDSVFFCDDSNKDADKVRNISIDSGEEIKLYKKNQTIHYDGPNDMARDTKNTKFMVSKDKYKRMGRLNCIDFDEGLREIKDIAKDIMKGKIAFVKIFCEGPTESVFSRPCVQITDSAYVLHSEDILYRRGYEHFRKMKNKDDFWRFCHSSGRLDSNKNSVDIDKRRIYMDLENNIVYSMNAQYAGNTVGLKKHSMRLAINEGGKEGWLCEHMFLMSILNEERNRKTYLCGAFPSACGKTSTAMIPGEKILGDDICYFRNIDGEFRAVNVENGIFGIIKDVNEKDDPVIFKALCEPREIIFSNILKGSDGNPYWTGMGVDIPNEGVNFTGRWKKGDRDKSGNLIPIGHPNSRYTMRLDYLDNIDEEYNNKDGVKVDAIIYGGRDSDTTVPIEMSRNWIEGIILKAATLESETTSATIGSEGRRVPCLMANLDFISYPVGEYIENNVHFVDGMKKVPHVFAVNYFLKKEGRFCLDKLAKKVWLHWAEGMCHGDYGYNETPTGYIPKYKDLKKLFKDLLDVNYKLEDYNYQFTFRCNSWTNKLIRSKKYFKENFPGTPDYVFSSWDKLISEIDSLKTSKILPGKYKKKSISNLNIFQLAY